MAREKVFARGPLAEKASAMFQAAIENARRAVHRDQRRASQRVGEILGVISEKLCDPGFDGEELKRICPPDSDAFRLFRIEMGLKPKAYLDRCRFEIARDLVRESRVHVYEIARLVGFRDPKLFTSWFKQRTGLAPRSLRAELQSGKNTSPVRPSPDPWPAARIWQMCLLGRAGREDAASLVRILRRTYPADS